MLRVFYVLYIYLGQTASNSFFSNMIIVREYEIPLCAAHSIVQNWPGKQVTPAHFIDLLSPVYLGISDLHLVCGHSLGLGPQPSTVETTVLLCLVELLGCPVTLCSALHP